MLSKHRSIYFHYNCELNQVKKYWPDKNIQLKPNAIHIPQNKAVDKKGFVFVGRLEPGKGIEALLQTWANTFQPRMDTDKHGCFW